jgi:hypothetical protein
LSQAVKGVRLQPLTVAPGAGSYGVLASGGGIQLIILNSFRYLEVE